MKKRKDHISLDGAEFFKELFVNAIIGCGVSPKMPGEYRKAAEKTGLVVVTGDQWNPSWMWSRKALQRLNNPELAKLYNEIR